MTPPTMNDPPEPPVNRLGGGITVIDCTYQGGHPYLPPPTRDPALELKWRNANLERRNERLVETLKEARQALIDLKAQVDALTPLDVTRLTRLTVADSGTLAYERYNATLELAVQDDGRTLKVYVTPRRGRHAAEEDVRTETDTKAGA
jgi:hypothetical protein